MSKETFFDSTVKRHQVLEMVKRIEKFGKVTVLPDFFKEIKNICTFCEV